jgi:ATP-dependent DNA ligase
MQLPLRSRTGLGAPRAARFPTTPPRATTGIAAGWTVEWPASVALAQSVPELPTGTGWSYGVKLGGHRMIMWRTDEGVRLQARSGRDVTAAWGDLALAGHHLPAGTVLDGVM